MPYLNPNTGDLTTMFRKPTIFVISAILLCLCFLSTGCSFERKAEFSPQSGNASEIATTTPRPKGIQEVEFDVLRHLSNKYGCSFDCVGRNEPTILDKTYTFIVVSHEKPLDNEKTFAYYFADTGEYRDNYWGLLKRGDIDNLVSPFLPNNARVFCELSDWFFPENLNRNSPLESAAPVSANIYIFTDSSFDTDDLRNELRRHSITGTILVYQTDSDTLERLDYKTYSDTIKRILLGHHNGKRLTSQSID